jgi:transposase-like protein
VVCSDTWKAYTGIAAKGYVHRLVDHGEGQYSDEKRNHINGLEGFWGYLKRKLASKGGVRRERLPLFLGEYIWRYNHRSDPERIKSRRIIQLLEKSLV